MALHWNWETQVGRVIYEDGHEEKLYQGNAYLIAIYEYKENGKDMYNMTWFAVNRHHMKNILGLNEKNGYSENILENSKITDIYITSRHSNADKIIADIIKSKWAVNLHYCVEP